MSVFTYSYAFCSKQLIQTFVDFNRFTKGNIYDIFIEYSPNERHTNKMRTKLT